VVVERCRHATRLLLVGYAEAASASRLATAAITIYYLRDGDVERLQARLLRLLLRHYADERHADASVTPLRYVITWLKIRPLMILRR